MSARSRLLRSYPPGWRARYGDDLAAYLDDRYQRALPARAVLSLVRGGLRERARAARVVGTVGPAEDRLRAGALMVLTAWAAFVVAGASFAKVSEHFDSSLTDAARGMPDAAYTLVRGAASLTAVVVAAGLGLAVPALLRLLTGGGWPLIRRQVRRAAVASLLTVGMTVLVGVWARHLTDVQRNGGSAGYGAAFLGWVGLVVLSIGLWTAAAVSAARHVCLSRRVLLAEGVLATVATAGMIVILVCAMVWWAAMTSTTPSFSGARLLGAQVAATPPLVGTVVLMLGGLTVAVVGVVRVIQASSAVRHAEGARQE